MKQKNSEKGQALVVIALAAMVLFGFAALAIDGSMVFSDRRHAQNAADTAVMASALARTRGRDLYVAGQDRATSNGYDDNGTSNIVDITTEVTPKGACPATGEDITIKITSYVKTTFARILGWTQLTNVVYATARSCDLAGGKPLYAGSAVWSTKSSGSCNGTSSKSLYVGGSGNLNVYGGGLGSAMSEGSCIDFSGGVTALYSQGTDCGGLVTAAPSGDIPPTNLQNFTNNCSSSGVEYSASFDQPPADLGITCAGNATVSGNTMRPGNYNGDFPPSGVTDLNPGTYCINGNFKLNANQNLTGTGVTIVMNTGYITWNGSSEAKLTAPTSGDRKGLLIYLPPSNNSDITLDGSGSVTMTGTVLAQNSNCYYAGTGDVQRQTLQFICSTWQTNGNGTVDIVYDSSLFFEPVIQPSMSLLR